MELLPWKVLSSEFALDDPQCRIRRDQVQLPDGYVLDDYYLSVRPDVAIVLAISSTGAVPLVRQYKHGIRDVTLELPAGVFHPAESPAAAARRELREETGWEAGELACIAEFFDDPSKNTNRVFCFVGRNAYRAGPQRPDPIEAASGIELVEVTLDALPSLLSSGKIQAQSSVASAYRALAWLAQQ